MNAADLAQVCSFAGAVEPAPIIATCAKYPARIAQTDYGREDLRHGHVSWVDDSALMDQMWKMVQDINAEFFHFELEGILEPLQYAVYEVGDHFGWHVDGVPGQKPYRKLALSVQLSGPKDYDGGELQMQLGCWTVQMPKDAGDVIAFPSWLPHRVQPVTRGLRRALVIWAHGQMFK